MRLAYLFSILVCILEQVVSENMLLRGSPRKLNNGCPSLGFTTDPGYQPCNSTADCVVECADDEDCCCVEHNAPFFNYCGVPGDCNDHLSCFVPSSIESGRGHNNTGGTVTGVDVFGCTGSTGYLWCDVLNQCTTNSTCSAVITDENGCAVGYEEYCYVRQECMIVNGTIPCPNEPGSTPCESFKLYPISVTNANGDSFELQNGKVFDGNATQVKFNLFKSDDNSNGDFLGEFDFHFLNEEWQLPLGGGLVCLPFPYRITAYITKSLRRILQLCYDASDVPQGLLQQDADFSIPSCENINLNDILPDDNNYYESRFLVLP